MMLAAEQQPGSGAGESGSTNQEALLIQPQAGVAIDRPKNEPALRS